MSKSGKAFTDATRKFDRERLHEPIEAFDLVKSLATRKFDETVEAAFKLGVDPRKADQMLRGTVSLPNGSGKTVRVAAFAQGDAAREAEEAGAERVVRAQFLLGRERKLRQVGELLQIRRVHALRVERGAVVGNVVVGVLQAPAQAFELQRLEFIAAGALDGFELGGVGAKHRHGSPSRSDRCVGQDHGRLALHRVRAPAHQRDALATLVRHCDVVDAGAPCPAGLGRLGGEHIAFASRRDQIDREAGGQRQLIE